MQYKRLTIHDKTIEIVYDKKMKLMKVKYSRHDTTNTGKTDKHLLSKFAAFF